MAGFSKTLGAVLVAIGLSAAVTFCFYTLRDEEYPKAALLLERNPGNVMYEARYGAAFIKRVFLVAGGAAGVLLALNGTTLLLVGVLAGRQSRGDSARASNPPR